MMQPACEANSLLTATSYSSRENVVCYANSRDIRRVVARLIMDYNDADPEDQVLTVKIQLGSKRKPKKKEGAKRAPRNLRTARSTMKFGEECTERDEDECWYPETSALEWFGMIFATINIIVMLVIVGYYRWTHQYLVARRDSKYRLEAFLKAQLEAKEEHLAKRKAELKKRDFENAKESTTPVLRQRLSATNPSHEKTPVSAHDGFFDPDLLKEGTAIDTNKTLKTQEASIMKDAGTSKTKTLKRKLERLLPKGRRFHSKSKEDKEKHSIEVPSSETRLPRPKYGEHKKQLEDMERILEEDDTECHDNEKERKRKTKTSSD